MPIAAVLLAAAAMSCLGPATQTVRAAGVTETRLFYGHGAVRVAASSGSTAPMKFRRLRMNLVRPAPGDFRGPLPVVVLIHGGGFTHGSYLDQRLTQLAQSFAANGIAAASIEYRIRPMHPAPSRRVEALLRSPTFPATFRDRSVEAASAVDDTLSALAFLRGHASKLNLDRRRIGLVGESAGAATANHVAYALDDHSISRPPIRFVGSLWGAMLIAPQGRAGRSPRSPVTQMRAGEPPLFLAHGDRDTSVMCPVDRSDAMAARARRAGIQVRYMRLKGRGHGFSRSGFFGPSPGGGPSVLAELIAFAAARLGR